MKTVTTLLLAVTLFVTACATKPPKTYKEYDLSAIREKKRAQKEDDKWFVRSLVALIILAT